MSRAHGTHARYVLGAGPNYTGGCRCAPCRAANAAYERERAKRPAPPYVDAAETREHVRDLMAHGVGLKAIARRSCVAVATVGKLLYGDPRRNMAPSKRIRPGTRDALLAVKRTDHADGARVPAGPTWQTIDTLLGRGWTKAAISRAIGQAGPGLQLSPCEIVARHARTIASLLNEPVPDRRSRHGLHPQPQINREAERRDRLRRAAEAEHRKTYRYAAAAREAVERGEDPFELPDLFAAAGDWMRRAACRKSDIPTWLFFAASNDARTVDAARAVCATCPVQSACLTAGTGQDGMWGGHTAAERTERLAVAS